MEDTLSHTRITSTTNPMDVSDEEEDKDVIRTTPNLAISSRRSIVEEVTDDGAIQEMEFIADKEKDQNQDELVDLKHIEQELLKNQQDKEKDLKLNQKPMIVQEDLDPNVVPVEVPVKSTQPPGITVFENSTKKSYFVSFTHPLTPLLSTHTLEAHTLSPNIPSHHHTSHLTTHPIPPLPTSPQPPSHTHAHFTPPFHLNPPPLSQRTLHLSAHPLPHPTPNSPHPLSQRTLHLSTHSTSHPTPSNSPHPPSHPYPLTHPHPPPHYPPSHSIPISPHTHVPLSTSSKNFTSILLPRSFLSRSFHFAK